MKTSRHSQTQWVLFPKLLLRIAGLPLNQLNGLIADSLALRLEEWQHRRACCQRRKTALLDALFAFVQSAADRPAEQKMVQNVRRDLFNDRTIRERDWTAVLNMLPEPLRGQAECYRRSVQSAETHRHTTLRLYRQQALNVRRRFQHLIRQESFRKGLAMSSLSLFDTLPHYAATSVTQFRKDDFQVENGLIRYFSRMVTKTSPYSTFTRLAFADADTPGGRAIGGADQSHVQLNAGLFQTFREILVQNRALRSHLLLRTNPSLLEQEGRLLLIRQTDSEVSCGRLPTSRMLRNILKSVGEGREYDCLVDELSTRYRLKTIHLHQYIDKLAELGLVEADFGISANDVDWPHQLLAWMNRHFWMAPAFLGALKTILNRLMSIAAELPTVTADRRRVLLAEATEHLQRLGSHRLSAAPSARPALRPEQVFFEDVTLPQASVPMPQDQLTDLIELAGRLAGAVRAASPPDDELPRLFRQVYGTTAEAVPLTDFFEKYLRNRPETLAKSGETGPSNPHRWASLVRSMGAGGVVHLDSHLLPACPPVCRSESQFMQVWYDKGHRLNGVLNGQLPGYGRMYGRFLRYAEPDLTTQLRLWNETCGGRVLLAEAADDSVHNANMHPALLAGQVRTPLGQLLPDAEAFPMTDLFVRLSPSGRLELRYRSGREVELFDMGFQANRSLLVQFLSRFSDQSATDFGPFCESLNALWRQRMGQATAAVCVSPRLVLDGRLVVQRRSWQVDAHLEPSLRQTDDSAAFYLALSAWRSVWKIPDEVFVHLPDAPARDDQKPQYVHFQSPLFIDLFRRLLRKAVNGDGRLKLVEMYPHSGQAVHIDGQPYVCEAALLSYARQALTPSTTTAEQSMVLAK